MSIALLRAFAWISSAYTHTNYISILNSTCRGDNWDLGKPISLLTFTLLPWLKLDLSSYLFDLETGIFTSIFIHCVYPHILTWYIQPILADMKICLWKWFKNLYQGTFRVFMSYVYLMFMLVVFLNKPPYAGIALVTDSTENSLCGWNLRDSELGWWVGGQRLR